jgi:hypothetical protein
MDDNIQIPVNTPLSLRKEIEQMQKWYDDNDDFNFDLGLDAIEGSIKTWYLAGKLSRSDAIKIFHKFGIMY